MPTIHETLAYAAKNNLPILLFGGGVDGSRINDEIERVVGKTPVVYRDWSMSEPTLEDVRQAFREGMKDGRTLHVSVGDAFSSNLQDALLDVLSDGHLPGRDETAVPSGWLVVSTKVRLLSSLGLDPRELFSVCMGVER